MELGSELGGGVGGGLLLLNDPWPSQCIPRSPAEQIHNTTNCQDIYRGLVDVEPHPLGSVPGFALAGGSEDVLSHGRGEVEEVLVGSGSRSFSCYEFFTGLRWCVVFIQTIF